MSQKSKHITINISGNLLDLDFPKVMGILNVTPDSFYSYSRRFTGEDVKERIVSMLEAGVDIIDIGGCSTRPGFETPSEEEELARVELGCKIAREISTSIPLSIDTFRASIARYAVESWNVNIVNDVSGGLDPKMWRTVADLRVAYVLTHNRQESSEYKDVTAEVLIDLAKQKNELCRLGVNDIIIDPGFGFAKTLEENFRLLEELNEFKKFGLPLLVGISRKSMIYKTLICKPEDSLIGTVALNSIALEKGANILRVHDIKETKEIVRLFTKLKESIQ